MDEYKLVWEDDFNTNVLNTKFWNFDLYPRFTHNEELQDYTDDPSNIYFEDSCLIIRALQIDYKNRRFSSARINTRLKKSWLYGKIESKIKLPYGQGIWPAFWLLGENKNWPGCGEIDIMEMIGGGIGRDDTVYGTIHWKGKDDKHVYKGNGTDGRIGFSPLKGKKLCDNFHTYGIEWNEEKIVWTFNSMPYFEQSIDSSEMQVFHKPFYIIVNLAVGGIWPGNPDERTVFPQSMKIDWIRVWQKNNGVY